MITSLFETVKLALQSIKAHFIMNTDAEAFVHTHIYTHFALRKVLKSNNSFIIEFTFQITVRNT